MKMGIRQLAEEDRPREKMLKHGAESLSKSELLAILVGSGTRDENAVSLMQRILGDCNGNLRTLSTCSLAGLCKYKGIGPAKAVAIKAACQLGKLMQAENVEKRAAMTDPLMVRDYFAPFMADKDNEEVWVLLLDNRLHVIADRQISKGGISEATVDVRLVLREALLARATAMILVHNHPTGNVLPSDADDRLTKKVADAGKLMNITLRDHVIVGGDSYYSYCEQGKL